jgi:hypothetical protein
LKQRILNLNKEGKDKVLDTYARAVLTVTGDMPVIQALGLKICL